MYGNRKNSTRHRTGTLASLLVMLLIVAGTATLAAKDKKKVEKPVNPLEKKTFLDVLDYSKIVWPNPPAITRVRYLNYFAGEKYKPQQAGKAKSSWMERLSGATLGSTPADQQKPRFQLVMPYGMGIDSKNRLYIADRKVSAVFIVNTENWEFEMIKNGSDARFGTIIGIVIDDADRLFVSDSSARRVLVFDAQHKLEGSISQGLSDPGGMAIDNENRFLYVADAGNDQIMVYDADPPYKLLRRIGTGGKQHTLTSPGDFAKPTNVAVDDEGNLYVADTWNDRVEIFDADGNFIRTFGKAGDGPGYFARPKGIAVDSDGHIWVADAVQDRVQVFSQEGDLLLWMGGHGLMPGQFKSLAGLFIDKNNRVFTSEQFPGRVQMFRYTTDEEARAELKKREEADKKKSAERSGSTTKKVADEKAADTPMPAPK
jgi:DNA-binding beta-propeller fold protein YncE